MKDFAIRFLLICLCFMPQSAYCISRFVDNGILYVITSVYNREVRAHKSDSEMTSIDVPTNVYFYGYNFKVTDVSPSLFENKEVVYLPETLKEIKDGLFCWKKQLREIYIPNSVTSIGDGAFRGCDNLTSINIPNSVTRIGKNAFSGCKKLTSIEIPYSVTFIGDKAFDCCSQLETVVLPDELKEINNGMFYMCEKLKHVEFGNINRIGSEAFCYCNSLEKITIPGSVRSIGAKAFEGCSAKISFEDMTTLETVGAGAISPYNLKKALHNGKVFWEFADKKYEIPEGIEEIPEGAISCGRHIVLPSTLKRMYCKAAKFDTITCLSETPPDLGDNVIDKKNVVRVHSKSLEAYRKHALWGKATIETIDGLDTIYYYYYIAAGVLFVIFVYVLYRVIRQNKSES